LLADAPDLPPALDPLIVAPPQTVRTCAAAKNASDRVVNDRQAVPTPPRSNVLVQTLAHPGDQFLRLATRTVLLGVE